MNDTQALNAVGQARALAAMPGAESSIAYNPNPWGTGYTVKLTVTAFVGRSSSESIEARLQRARPELFDGDVIVRGGQDA